MSVDVEAAREALTRLRRWGHGADTLARSMAALFAEGVDERLTAMRAALDADDRGALANAAHSLRATCGQMGAATAESLCRTVEAEAPNGSPAGLAALVARLDAACAAHVDWLDHELSVGGRGA